MAAIQNLWEESGKSALTILHGKGLTDKTIKEASLGFNPSDSFLDRESWGLPPEIRENGKSKKLWLPAGIVIPLIENNQVIRLRFRRLEGEPRYYLIPGSDIRPMTWNLDSKVLIIIESELDGLLLNQEAGDLVGVVALGSATSKPDKITHDALMRTDSILVALDKDEAGAKASWSFWPQTYGTKVKRWPCIMGKDPSDAWKNGLNIRAWVIAGISDAIDKSRTTMESSSHTPQEDIQTMTTLEMEHEAKHAEEIISLYSIPQESPETPRQKILPESIINESWPPDIQSLIDWFLKSEPPAESFYLEPHMYIMDPAKFFDKLRREIETGPRGPRARTGALQSDLRKLNVYFADMEKTKLAVDNVNR